jgi:hypothetical protein
MFLCDLILCPDWQASLEAALTAIGVDTNTSVVTNNGDGTYTHNDGTGVTVLIDTRANSNPYDNATSGLAATTVQAAVDELADCCPTYSVAAAAGTDALGNAYNVGDAIATLPNGTIYLIEGSISHNADTTSADLATAIAALPAAAGEGDTASWVRPDGNETASFHYTDGAWRLMGGSAATADNLRAWGTAAGQQSNADDVAVGDAIYHTGTVTIGETVAGHDANTALTVDGASSFGASNHTVGGANSFTSGNGNTNSAVNGFVGGGTGNTVSGTNSAVVGGQNNTASGLRSSVVGGLNNTATGVHAVTIGGARNISNGNNSAVIGGNDNVVSGVSSAGGGSNTTVGGGTAFGYGTQVNVLGANSAAFGSLTTIRGTHNYSFGTGNDSAAVDNTVMIGANLDVNHNGVALMGDNSAIVLTSTVADEFATRFNGGYRLFSNSAQTAGVTMATATSAWVAVSDSSTKTDFGVVDADDILSRLGKLDVITYITKAQKEAGNTARQIGLRAEQFNAVFGGIIGEKRVGKYHGLSNLDVDGVMVAAIKALLGRVEQLETQLLAA